MKGRNYMGRKDVIRFFDNYDTDSFCTEDDAREIAEVIAERTRSQVVQVIGKKIVLYKEGKDDKKKIELPKAKKNV